MQLLLLRHAKSSWAEPGTTDKQRPLNDRGRAVAVRMGRYMRDNGLVPDEVFCSPATRVRQTWSLVSEAFDKAPEAQFVEKLYSFGAGEELLRVIRSASMATDTLMIVGHNPSMESLAAWLAPQGTPAALARLERKYPTCGLAIIAFPDEGWKGLSPGTGYLKDFVTPKSLGD